MRASAIENTREKFFRLLFHDDRNSYYVISSDASGEWADAALRVDALSSYQFDMVHNYYITHNGFTGKRRLSVRTRQLNALFFDVDFHGVESSECVRLINITLERLNMAVQTAALPKPTMIVDSGRGVHLYYVLDRSVPYRFRKTGEVNEPGISFFNHVQTQLADLLDELLADVPEAKVDRAVFDYTRVSRIPNTFNAKAGRHSRLVFAEEVYHSLSDLNAYRAVSPARKQASQKKLSGRAVIMKYDRLLLSRLNKISELQEYRKYRCDGNREVMSFVFYNTAAQIYRKEDAWDSLVAFNSRFSSPLALSELEGIRKAVSSVRNVKGEVGYYVLSANKIIELLALTDAEIEATHFFASRRMVARMEAKRKTKDKKDARDKRIVELYGKGSMTQQQVADAVGCSARTVYAVLKAANLPGRRSSGVHGNQTVVHAAPYALKEAARAALDRASRDFSSAEVDVYSFSTGFRKFMADVSLSSVWRDAERFFGTRFKGSVGFDFDLGNKIQSQKLVFWPCGSLVSSFRFDFEDFSLPASPTLLLRKRFLEKVPLLYLLPLNMLSG